MKMITAQTTTATADWNGTTPGFPNSSVLGAGDARLHEIPHLSIRVLETAHEREAIAHLRQYADFRSEYELDPGMADFEAAKDELGIVMAISLGEEAIATIRFIPTGHGVTLTERFWRDLIEEPGILGSTSWEVGRLVMAPENRRADLLPRCMALALITLVNLVHVEHMHASCLTSMTRLYRRFGFGTHAVRSKHDKHCALIHGRLRDVASALKVQMPDQVACLHLPSPVAADVHLLQ